MAKVSSALRSPRKTAAKRQQVKQATTGTKRGINKRRKVVQAESPTASEGSSRPRRASRCAVCPGKPLRSQCSHTKIGQAYLLEQSLRLEMAGWSPTAASNSNSLSSSQAGLNGDSNPEIGSQSDATLSLSFPQPADTQSLASGALFPFASTVFSTPERPLLGPNALRNYALNIPPSVDMSGRSHTMPSDSYGFGFGHPTTPTPPSRPSVPQLRPPTDLESPMAPDHMAMSDPTSFASSPLGPLTLEGTMSVLDPVLTVVEGLPPTIIRPTTSNPLYGNVQGILRGASHTYDLIRKRQLPSPLTDSSRASTKFRDTMNTIFRKCEELAAETSCWLFIGAQHAGARGATLHYASPRLRRDGGAETNELATHLLRLIKQIEDNRRIDVMELQKNLRESEQQKSALSQQISDLEVQVQDEQEKHRRDEQLLRVYAERLGISKP